MWVIRAVPKWSVVDSEQWRSVVVVHVGGSFAQRSPDGQEMTRHTFRHEMGEQTGMPKDVSEAGNTGSMGVVEA